MEAGGKKAFAGDVLKLASGTAFAQAVSILAAPVLSRLYAPEAFGVSALFLSITGIFGVIACLRYEMAIMLPEKDEDAASLVGLSAVFAVVVASVTAPLLWWVREPFLESIGSPALGRYLWLIPPAILVSGVFLALNYWNTRTKRFGRLSVARIVNSLTTTPLTVGLGFAGHATAGSMIGANVAGQGVATALLGWRIWREDRALFIGSFRRRPMAENMKRYRKFPLYDSWAGVMNAVSGQLPPLLLAAFFSSTIVGFYALGYRLLTMPSTLVGGAISQVFFRHAAEARKEGTLARVAGGTFGRLMALGFLPILLVMIAGEEIFTVVFGSRWAEAGVYAQVLAPWILFNFVSAPMTAIFPVLEMQERFLLFNAVLLGTRIAGLTLGGLMGSVLVSLALFSVTGAMIYGFLCLFILKEAGLSVAGVFTAVARPVGGAFLAAMPVILLKIAVVSPLLLAAACCVSALAYYAALLYRDDEIGKLLAGRAGEGDPG